MKTMTSKERVLATFARQPADRVPVNYMSNPDIDRRLKAHFELNAKDGEGLLRALGVDFRSVGAPYVGPQRHPPRENGVQVDIWGIHRKWVEHPAGGYFDYCDFPLKDASLEQVEAWPMPTADDYDYAGVAAQCERHKEFCIALGNPGLGDSINSAGMIRTMEQVLVDLMTGEAAGIRYITRRHEVLLEVTRRTLEAAKGKVDMLWIGEDLGSQRGPLISLKLFRKYIRPWLQRYVDLGKAWKIPVMIHSCGSSSWAFDDFIEMGIAAVDTLQPEAANMAPAYLKQRYGDRLAFHGCISTAGPVATGTVEQVRQTVRETLATMMPGGGYCLAPTHCLQDNSPTENVVAMYEVARERGGY